MALTGLFLVLFLLVHMFGNLKLIGPNGAEHFDAYAEGLRTLLYPYLPEKFFLWIFRLLIIFSVGVHMWAAGSLTMRDYNAKGGLGRYIKRRYLDGSFAARTMIWGGVIIFLGLIAHLAQFTWQWIRISYPAGADTQVPHARVILAFQNWWVVLLYLVWLLAVSIHIWHGFYSALVTLGARVGADSYRVIKFCAWLVTIAVLVGFMLVPVLTLSGVITL